MVDSAFEIRVNQEQHIMWLYFYTKQKLALFACKKRVTFMCVLKFYYLTDDKTIVN